MNWNPAPLLLCFALILGGPAWAAVPLSKDANVLLITADTLRYDRVSFLSSKYVKTPHMDALAERSLTFTRAFAHSTLTRPSHTNILTGMTPLYHGVSDNPGFRLESHYRTLAEHLKAAGYETGAFIGAFVLDSRFGLDAGFDVYDDSHGQSTMVERRAEDVVQPALKWIGDRKGKWFAWVHLFDPHDPYDPPEPYKSDYHLDPYSGEVAYMDAQLGVLFDALKKSGAMERTIVVLTSDHGESLGEKGEERHGFFAYNAVLHIPLFIASPGVEPGIVRENAGHVDIFPSVCELVGLPVPSQLQGESLLPLAAGKGRKNAAIYFESLSPHYFLDAAPLQGFIQGDRKFIDQPIREVYDLQADYREERNLAPALDLAPFISTLDGLRKSLKGKGTRQDLEGKNQDIRPLMESLGYLAGTPSKKKSYGVADDLKSLQPLIAQLRVAIEEAKGGKTAPALAKISNIIRIRPTYVTAYRTMSSLYADMGQIDSALSILRDGLDVNSENLPLITDLGVMLIRAKKSAEAVEPLEYAARKDVTNPDVFNYLGRAFMDIGQWSKAEAQFEKALGLDPEMVEVFNNLGYLYLIQFTKSGDEKLFNSAVWNFEKALSYNPELDSAIKGRSAAESAKAKLSKR